MTGREAGRLSRGLTARRRQLLADLVLLGISVTWGFTFIWSKEALTLISPWSYNGLRLPFAAIVLSIIFAGRLRQANRSEWRAGAILGTVLLGALTLQAAGLQRTTIINTGFITALYVVIVPLLAPWLLRQWPSWQTWVGTLMAFAGLALLSVNEALGLSSGDLLVLAGAFCYALHITLINRLIPSSGQDSHQRLDSVRVAAIQFIVAAVLAQPIAWAVDGPPVAVPPRAWALSAFMGIVGMAATFGLQVIVQPLTLATHAAVIFSLEAVFAALAGALFLGEGLALRGLAGCALMLLGALVVELPLEEMRELGGTQGN